MNVYIFEEIERLTTHYHSGGGLVVVAKDMRQVEELIKEANETKPQGSHHKTQIVLTAEEIGAVKIYPLTGDPKPDLYTFRDAGCC